MKENTKKLLLTIVLILTLILNVKYVYAVDLNSDEDIVIDTDLQDIKSKEVITTKENIIREEVKETPSVQESKSESVTKAQDEVQDAKSKEVVKSAAANAPNETKAEAARDGETEEPEVFKTVIYIKDMRTDEIVDGITLEYKKGDDRYNYIPLNEAIPNALRVFSKDGYRYTFAGWYTAAEGGEQIGSTNKTFKNVRIKANTSTANSAGELTIELLQTSAAFQESEEITLYGKWTKEKIPVLSVQIFDTRNDPISIINSIDDLKTRKQITGTVNRTYSDDDYIYTFAGWFTDEEGGEQITSDGYSFVNAVATASQNTNNQEVITIKANNKITADENIKVYARWTKEKIPKIYIHFIDGRTGEESTKSPKIPSFLKGFSVPNLLDGEVKDEPNCYCTTSSPTCGTGRVAIYEDDKVYIFNGWFTEATGGELIDDGDIIDGVKFNISGGYSTLPSHIGWVGMDPGEVFAKKVENQPALTADVHINLYAQWVVVDDNSPKARVHVIDTRKEGVSEENETIVKVRGNKKTTNSVSLLVKKSNRQDYKTNKILDGDYVYIFKGYHLGSIDGPLITTEPITSNNIIISTITDLTSSEVNGLVLEGTENVSNDDNVYIYVEWEKVLAPKVNFVDVKPDTTLVAHSISFGSVGDAIELNQIFSSNNRPYTGITDDGIVERDKEGKGKYTFEGWYTDSISNYYQTGLTEEEQEALELEKNSKKITTDYTPTGELANYFSVLHANNADSEKPFAIYFNTKGYYTIDKEIPQDINIYAYWDAYITPELYFNCVDNVSTASGSWHNPEGGTTWYEHTFSKPDEPGDYKFQYWDIEGTQYQESEIYRYDFEGKPSGTVETVNAYAYWRPGVRIQYYDEYNTGDLIEETKYSFDKQVVTTNIPTKRGYDFAGWVDENNQPVEAGITEYGAPEVFFENKDEHKPLTVKLYATWTRSKETITITKNWVDSETKEYRPSYVNIKLTDSQGVEYSYVIVAPEEESENNNTWMLRNVEIFTHDINGNNIYYTLSEEEVPSYSTEINGYTITNRLKGDSQVKVFYRDIDTGAIIADTVTLTGKIDQPYASEQKDIDKYQFVEVYEDGAPASGIYKDYKQEVTYLYEKAIGEVIVHLVDYKDGEYISEDVNGDAVEYRHPFTGVIGESYTEDIANYPIDIPGYKCIGIASTEYKGGADNNLQLGVYTREGKYSKEVFDIFFVYKKLGTVTVHHYLEGTTDTQVAADEIFSDIIGSTYATDAKTEEELPNYTLVTSPDHNNGTYGEEPIEIIYYYAKKDANVIIHYIDTEGNKIAEDDEKPGKVGERYNTSDKVISIDGYFYLAPRAGDKEVGVYTIEPQEVYYVYMKGTYIGPEAGLKGDIFIRKENGEWNTENKEVYSGLYENDVIDIGTSLEIAPIKQQLNDTVAEMYKLIKNGYIPTEEEFRNIIRLSNVHSGFTTTITIPKGIDIDNATFNLLALSGEDYESAYNGMYELIPVEINPNEDGSTTVVIKMVLKDQTSMDSDNYSTLYEEFNTLATNLANEPDYLTFIIYGAKIAEGVKNQTLTILGNVNGSLDADANGTVSVETPFGTMNVPLPDRHFRFDWGSTQNHNEPHWNDAKDATITDENNHSIQLTLQVLAHGKVITHYVDKETGDKISEDDGLYKVYSTNDPYETTKKEITDYTYDSDTGNTKGVFEENDIDVTYYYIKNNGTVTVHYRDQKTGEDLPYTLEVLTGKIGTGYETEKKEFPNTHYEYKEVVGDTIGTYSSTPIEVIYYYVWKQGTVIVHHVDAETNEELTEEPDKFTGDVDSDYTALAKDIEHYTLTSDSGNRIGTYTEEDIEVTFYYTRNTGKVIVNYVDEDGNLLYTVEESGKVETESYTTEIKSFENYTLDEGQEVQTVTYTEDTQTITYTYSKNKGLVTVRYVAEDQDEDLDTIVIDTKKIGETYTSAPNEYDHYTLVEVPANANGTVEATPIEVIYNYVRNTGKIIVHYVDADTNEELDTVEKSGKVETGSYTTEIKSFENYTPVEEYEPESVTYTEETQEITYKYTKNNGLVIVHYVDKDTNEDIETVRITDKKVDEAYTTEQKEFRDYHYVDKSDNTKGTVKATETNVYYYYEKDNGTVIVHHIGIKDETEKELDLESLTGKIDNDYTTSSKEFEHYTLDQTRIPEPGKFVSGSINVYYYYTWNKGQVVVHYVADDQETELNTITLDPANVDSKYETEAKEFTSYRLTGDSGNRIGIVTEGQTDVYYYYTRLESDVTVHYVDADTNEELATEYGHGKVGETYTLINKDFENYTLVSAPEGETVTYTEEPIELTYTYKKNSGSITVYYKDLFTGEEIEGVEVKNTSGYVDQKYNAEPIDIEGYKFIRTEGNEELVGNYPNGENYVFTHYYQKVGKVIVHYYEVDSTTKVAEDVELETRPIGDTYITEAAKVEGYNLVETPTNAIGKYREALTEVIYYYEKLGNVITHFLNTNGEEVADSDTQSGVVGSDYTTEPAEVEGYELVGTPQNATGTYAKEDTHVYYIYGEPVEPTPEVNYGKVIVHYIDEEGNQLIDNIPLMGEVGTEYNAPEIPIAGYVLIDAVRINTQRALLRSILPEGKPNIGLFEDEPFQVNMIYRKVEDPKPETGKVIVLYTDTEGYELQKPIEIPGNVGDEYITSQPKIDGYKIYEVKGEKRGKIVAGTTYVEYVYEKVEEPSEPTTPDIEKGTVIAYYVDENGNSIADPMIIPGTYGTTYITYQKVIPGYTGTSIPENRIGKIEQELLELYYEYAKNEEQEEPGSSCEGNCNCCNTCNTCNCNNGENQQPQIIININNENNSDNHSENHNDNSSDNHSENNNDNNVNNEVNNDTNVENNTDVNNENNNQDETNVNIENNPVNNNDNNTTVETGDTNVDVTTGDTNVENNTTTGDTNVTTGDVTTGDTTVTTGDQTVNTGDTNVTTGDTTIENNPTVENNTNVETGDTTVDTGDINNNVETGDTNVTTGDTTIENNPTNNVENNTDVDASSNNNNENTNNSESNPVIDLDNSSNSESNPTIENNPTINVEVNPTIDNTSSSESNPTVDNSSNSDSSSSSESNPNVENNTTVENNPTNTNESNPTNNVDVNPTIENNPTNTNEGSNTNDNNPTNNNEGSNTNTNENNNTDSCTDCNNPSEEPTDKPVDPTKPTEPKTGKVIVKYVDEDGYSISPSVTIPGEVNENYSTDQLRIEGYELSSVTGDKEGQIPEGTGYVTYTYKVKESPKGTVIVHYQDEKGNTLAKDETINGNIGDSYNTTEKYVEGYELTEIKKDEPVAMKLMLKRAVINEENASGTIKEGTTEITYIYKEVEESTDKDPETGKVIARYLDENENSITPSIPFEGKVNDDYYTDQLKIDGYELVSVEGERNGKIAPGTTYVIYRYKTLEQKEEPKECCTNIEINCNSCPKEDPEKPDEPTDPTDKEDEKDPEEPQKGEVTARYIDTLGNKISGNITFRGTIGKSYETFAKLLEGYRLVRVEGVEKGTYTKDPAEVIYVYEKIVDEGEVQGETKTTPNEGTGSTNYELTPPSTNTDFNYLSLLIIPLLATFICKKKYN